MICRAAAMSFELFSSVKSQRPIMINNALGNFDLLVICGLCKLNPQCKPIHVRHIDYAQSANAPAYRADAPLETTAAGTPDR